jgi:hypothetical protein
LTGFYVILSIYLTYLPIKRKFRAYIQPNNLFIYDYDKNTKINKYN